MNKTLKIASISVLLLTAIALYLLYFKRGEDKVLDKVPIASTSVMVIDVRALSSKLLLDDFGKGIKNSKEAITKLLPDSLKDIDWTSNGLDLFSKIAMFTTEDTANVFVHFIIPISNTKKFNSFVSIIGTRLLMVIHESEHVKWAFASKPGILLVWDNHFVTGTMTTDSSNISINQLTRILKTEKSKSILADSCFTKKVTSTYDVLVYSKPYRKCPVEKLKVINDQMEYGSMIINFNSGELSILSEIKPKPESLLDKMFFSPNTSMIGLSNTAQAMVTAHVYINPQPFKQLLNQYKPFDYKLSIPYTEAWNGQLDLTCNGIKTIKKEYTTYTYDDNFNKIATTKTTEDKTWDVQASVGTDQAKIDSLQKLYPPVKEGRDTLLFSGGNFVWKKTSTGYITYIRSFSKPGVEQKLMEKNIEVSIDYQRLVPLLSDMGVIGKKNWMSGTDCKKLTFNAHKDKTIQLTGRIFFTDIKKNALYSMLETASHPKSAE